MKIYINFDIKEFNSLKISYICKGLFEVENVVEIYILLYIFKELGIEYFVLGNGSKVLFKNHIINKPIIYINQSFSDAKINENEVIVSSGYLLSKLIINLANYNYGCFEKLYPIPGTVGGLIFMNGGIKEYSISNFVRYIIIFDENLNVRKVNNKECMFDYRYSIFKNKKYVILYACLEIKKAKKELVLNNIKESILYRKQNQEFKLNSIGSLFKNSATKPSFELIKNTFPNSIRINGAYISKKHYNFLICEDASNDDVLQLIKRIRSEVYNKYKYLLELELNILE